MSEHEVLTCEEAIRLLAAYLDDELDGGSRSELERHLDACRSCYSRREFEEGLKEQLSKLGQEAVPSAFRERIQAMMTHFEEDADGPDCT